MPESHAVAYASVRERTTALATSVPTDRLERVAPATPSWRGRDILAHMVGVTNDVVNGRLEGIATDAWTQTQVDARTRASVDELLAEWVEFGPSFEEMLAAAPEEISGQALFDAATHEHDLRHLLEQPGARESDAMAIGWEWIVGARTRGGGSAIALVTEFGEDIAGVGEPDVRVEAPRFELLRASTGRRSRAEIERYQWKPAADPEILLASPIFSLRDVPLDE
jgi:hypothetical protein